MRLTPPLGPEQFPFPLPPAKQGTDLFFAPTAQPSRPPLPAAPSPAPTAAGETAVLTQQLGLPPDGLSAALLGFARFFALPLEPPLLHRLRREALSPAPRPGGEAAALAAAAAESKGLRLTGEALGVYAAAIDPGFREPPGEEPNHRRNHRDGRDSYDTPPEPGEIKKLAEETEAASPLLGAVNRLPGKDREQWIVLPFNFVSGGVEFKVSLRILLKSRGTYGYEAERLALDIRLVSRRWLFVLDKSGETGPETAVYISPSPDGKTAGALEKEIRNVLGAMGGTVTVKSSAGMPFFADSRDDTLRSINKEV